MTSLDEAAEAGQDDVIVAASIPIGVWMEIVDPQLVEADEVGTEEFPKYGQFMRCRAPSIEAGGEETVEERWIEVPGELARRLVEVLPSDDREGWYWRLDQRRKDPSGQWRFAVVAEEEPPGVENASDAM